MTPREVLVELRRIEEKYKNINTPTFEVVISDMARDAANAIEELLSFTDMVLTPPNYPIFPHIDNSQFNGQDLKNQDIYKLAFYDNLTGCYNRNMLEKMRSELDDQSCMVIIIDLDGLEEFNTNYGYLGGDRRLKEIAGRLQRSFRRVFRLGGDEFVVITESSRHFNQRFYDVDEFLNGVGPISYGVYVKKSDEHLSVAMHKADVAMRESKNKKKQIKNEE